MKAPEVWGAWGSFQGGVRRSRDSNCVQRVHSSAYIAIGRRITKTTGKSRETPWLEQRLGLAVQQDNALSILTAVRENYDVELETSADCLLNASRSSCKPPSLVFGRAVIRAVCHKLCFNHKYINYPEIVRILERF